MRVLLFAPNIDATDVGEAFVAFKWAEALADRVDLTVLAWQRPGRPSLAGQLPKARVVTWPEPAVFLKAERLNAMLKPSYPLLFRKVQRWIRAEQASGHGFDIAHQLMPQAARYPVPFTGTGIPFVIGPVGGSLETPPNFETNTDKSLWFTRLRNVDHWRFRNDPWLRKSYREAALVIGVAPYVETTLAPIGIRRFTPILELGIDSLAPPKEARTDTTLKLVHVGRGVRTKGLREVIRAMAQLGDLDVHLTSAGDGPETALCRAEADRLGVADRVTFRGQIPRDQVDALYLQSDIFTFPSYREPAGGVLFEAMRAGLPTITVAYGGPDHIIDDTSGIRLPLSTPEVLVRDIADAVRALAADPERRQALSDGARARVAHEGIWGNKITRMIAEYEQVLGGAEAGPEGGTE